MRDLRVSPSRLLLLTLVVACDGARDGAASSAGAIDSARPATVQAAPAGSPAGAAARRADSGTVGGGASDAGGPAREALCADVAAVAGRALQIAFTRDSGSTFPAPRGGPPWSGCLLRGSATVRPYGTAPMPDQKLIAAMRREGWVEDLAFQADGPEGNAFALRRGEALCHYNVLFPDAAGEDDRVDDTTAKADTSAAPLRYLVKILCTPSAPRGGA
jgi:hypothetical protein